MVKKSLTEEIHDWIGQLAYWEQVLAIKLLNKQTVTETDIKQAYKFFQEDNGLAEKKTTRPPLKIDAVSSIAGGGTDFLLKEIKEMKGVNALKEEQSITISKNLSIIYGENGVGKSGYIRMLNNAFLSRGDKTLMRNIYLPIKPKETSCVFKFKDCTNEYELKFPDNSKNYEFSCYSVFDSSSITAHLTSENVAQFLPNGLEFFDVFSNVITRVQELFENDIRQNSPANDLTYFFDNDTAIKKLVESLTGFSDIKVIKDTSNVSPEELIKLVSLEKNLIALKKIDVTKQVKSLKRIKGQLDKLKDELESLNEHFSEVAIDKLKKLIGDYFHNKKLSATEGLAQFETQNIGSVGSDEWKDLLVAAKAFAEIQYEDEDLYPVDKDFCLLCHQPLNKQAKQLIEAYLKFLTSNAERDLKKIADEISEQQAELEELDTSVLPDDSILADWLSDNSEASLKIWNAQIKSVEVLRKRILISLKNKKWNDEITAKQISVKAFPAITKSLQEEISGLNEEGIIRKIKLTEKEIQELKDRKKLGTLLPKIEEYINKRKWATKATAKRFNTRKITQHQKELFSKFVTDEYIRIFNDECEKLDANFGCKISQRAMKGNTLKQLVLEGCTPRQILSEGEQRAISLADFLTEAQIGNKNKGIIFDDPVNSLDHTRRQTIAERLLQESLVRQVIVFTHDITFLLALQTLAETENVDCIVTTVRKIGNTPSIINNSLPWIASNVKERVKKLNEALPNLKKLEAGTDPDYYSEEAKNGADFYVKLGKGGLKNCYLTMPFKDSLQVFKQSGLKK